MTAEIVRHVCDPTDHECSGPGVYWILPDAEPVGPFETFSAAVENMYGATNV